MDILKLDNTKTIKQSNRLIVAKYKLTTYEQRMIIAICSQLDNNAKDFTKVRIRVKDMAEFCNFKGKDSYRQTKATIMKLAARTLQIKSKNGDWYVTHWLQAAKYFKSDGIIEYKIDNELKPELLQLKEAYLDTSIVPLIKFKSNYSARLYFILKKMLKVKDFEYDLDFFRERFCLGKSYKLFANMKIKIFEPAFKEINEKSDINLQYNYIKNGRSYTKIHFIVTEKDTKKNPGDSNIPQTIKTLPDTQKNILIRLINPDRWNLTEDVAKQLIKKYELPRIEKNLRYAYKYRNKKENLGGWLISCIKRDESYNQENRILLKKVSEKNLNKIHIEKKVLPEANSEDFGEKKSQPTQISKTIVEIIKKNISQGKSISSICQKELDRFGLTVDDILANRLFE